jgi:NADH-quinone oxidoreductase subunit M
MQKIPVLDNLHLIFIFLSVWVCLLARYTLYSEKSFFLVQVLLARLLLAFSINHFILLFVCFEFSLIPIFFLVNFEGVKPERRQAVWSFFFYTLLGALPFFLVLLRQIKKGQNMYFSGYAFKIMEKKWQSLAKVGLISLFLVKLPV